MFGKTVFNLFLIGITSISIGCSKSDDKSSGTPGGGQALDHSDITDRSTCSGQVPYDLDLYRNWVQDHVTRDYSYRMVYSFTEYDLELYTTCSRDGMWATARVRVPIQVMGNRIDILRGDRDQRTEYHANGNITCTVSVDPSTISYRIVGRCLEFNLPGKPAVQMPLEYSRY